MSIMFMYKDGWLLNDDSVLFEIPKLRDYLAEFVPEPEDWGDGCFFAELDENFTALNEFVPSLPLGKELRQIARRFREQSESLHMCNYFPDPGEEYARYYFSEDGRMLILCGVRTQYDKPLVPAKTVLDLLDGLIQRCEEVPAPIALSPAPQPAETVNRPPKKKHVVITIAVCAALALTLVGILVWMSQPH